MKTLILSMLVITMAGISYAQNVNIHDANFKNALISAGVDTNKDGEISHAEAEGITSLDVSEKSISDMTGIEAFVNLETLICHYNQLTSLDVSNNTGLISLDCSVNQLTSLDVSNNTALTGLSCGGNQLTSLDVSNDTALTFLFCGGFHYGNQLTSLDVSKNTALTDLKCAENQLTSLDVSNNVALMVLWCGENQLTSLDVSNNTALDGLSLDNMPTLYEVCVWEMPFPPADKVDLVDTTGSPNVHFTMDCLATDINATETNGNISAYPNPATEFLTFDLKNISETAIVELFDLQGNRVLKQKLSANQQISVSNLPEGLYMYKINNSGIIYTGKLTVE